MVDGTKPYQRTLGEILETSAEVFRSRPFVLFQDEVITYEEMDERTNRVANRILSLGLNKGDRVILFLENCPEWLYLWFGLAKIGVVSVILNTAHKGRMLEYFLSTSGARLMVASESLMERFEPFQDSLANLEGIVLLHDDSGVSAKGDHFMPFSELLGGSPSAPRTPLRYSDTVAIMYTSGTTGRSKGVVQPHGQYVWCGTQMVRQLNLTASDGFYCWLPLCHIGGVGMFVSSAAQVGASIALTRTLSIRRFWSEVRRYGATITAGFAHLVELLYKQPPKPDDGDNPMRHMMIGNPPESIRRAFEERFDLVITDDYGMTEVEPISYSLVGELDKKPGSCGKAVGDLEVKIFDDADKEVEPKEVGEIVVRPKEPHIMMEEYDGMPEETAESWRNSWFHTGDLGYQDEDGHIYFVDRKKDCIRRRGENISSVELETIVNAHPSVLESAAVGVPSDLGEEDVKVVVQLKPGESLRPEELLEYCRQEMAFFMVPRYIEFTDEFPRTDAFKILKRDLRTVTEITWDKETADPS